MPTIARSPDHCRARRRLLIAARCRFAEDRLADAVSAGVTQAVLLGTALDTFALHNPYPHLRVFQVPQGEGPVDTALAAMDFDHAQPGFVIRLGLDRSGSVLSAGRNLATEPHSSPPSEYATVAASLDTPHELPGISRELPGSPYGIPATLNGVPSTLHGSKDAPSGLPGALHGLGMLAGGSEIVFDYLPAGTPTLRELLSGTAFEVLEDLDSAALASRYLDHSIEATHSVEPRVVRARVRNTVGRQPS